MNRLRISLLASVLGVAALAGLAGGAAAQDYPQRPVRILVGYPPGGAPDFVARTMAQGLGEVLGQQFVVENKPGASGALATELVAKAAPDGHTLLVGETGQLQILPFILKPPPYDPVRDLEPVALVATTPTFLITSTKSNIRTVKDLIREAKANPGKLNYGSSGIGSIHHITLEAFCLAAEINMAHIPFRGAPLTLPALLSGEIHAMVASVGVVQSQMRAGTINILGVSSAGRFPLLPDVPPIADELKGFEFASETGILGPAGLPRDIKLKLSRAIKATLDKKEVRERYEKIALLITWSSPEGYAENIQHNLRKFEKVIKAANIQPN